MEPVHALSEAFKCLVNILAACARQWLGLVVKSERQILMCEAPVAPFSSERRSCSSIFNQAAEFVCHFGVGNRAW